MFLYINTQKGLKNFFWRASSGKYSVQLLENLATLVNIPFAFIKFFCVKFLLRKTPWQKSSLLLSTWLNAKVFPFSQIFHSPIHWLAQSRHRQLGKRAYCWAWDKTLWMTRQDSQLLISHRRNRDKAWRLERKSYEMFTIFGELSLLKHIDLWMIKIT